MRYKLIILLLLSFPSFGQKDTVQSVHEVVVTHSRAVLKPEKIERFTGEFITQQDVDELQPLDASEILQKFAGTSIKSYGGLGGIKTISMRGLGASHSNIVVDGFGVQNNQNGQVNLGQIRGDNITSAATIGGANLSFSIPVSAQVSGATFMLQTFENEFRNQGLQLRAGGKYGSFVQQNADLRLKFTNAHWLVSAMGNYRNSVGNYTYSIKNGNQQLNGIRANNDYQDYRFGSTVGYRSEHTTTRVGYQQSAIDQGLPGAVIFYNQTQDERLKTWDKKLFGDFVYSKDRLFIRVYASGRQNVVRYDDPDYLNTASGLSVEYQNRSLQGGILSRFRNKKKSWNLFGGIEHVSSDLVVNDSTFAKPVRQHHYGIIATNYTWKKLIFTLHLSEQYVSEQNRNGENAENRFRWNQFLSVETKELKKRLKHAIWFRSSFRMPSFNELYYNSIGNSKLVPEDANQISYKLSVVPFERKNFDLHFKSSVYLNFVKNKIIAVPTKNLFVWSMQNVGKTRVYGFEATMNLRYNFNEKWKLTTVANYSYQRTLDVTDVDSPTYGHQVAYVPVHTGNLDVSLYYKRTGVRFSNYATSLRYSLNENIELNEVDGFFVTDISVFHRFLIKKKHAIRLQFSAKNIFDVSYAYIRSFVMPGTNYLISLNYAFN